VSTVEIELPTWAGASPRRRAHIARVTALAASWADAMRVDAEERDAWHDAAQWHDALRDAGEAQLRAIVPRLDWPANLLHGPAAASRLADHGEQRATVLNAIFWHTVGNSQWDRTGRVLYMADYLEPGRPFEREKRGVLAASVPDDFEGTFRNVVLMRLGKKIAAGGALRPESRALWESVR
jgi:HD superfamily phosphohydrolase YqeK